MALDKSVIDAKRAVLEQVKTQLKQEFFGLDTIIDKVIDSMSAWYIFPELITRPVIINLWGLTGVGKCLGENQEITVKIPEDLARMIDQLDDGC